MPTEPRRSATLRALANPLRLQALQSFTRNGRQSPVEVARQLEQPVQLISYHVRVLAGAGLLVRAGTRQVRGAVQHFYLPSAAGAQLAEAIEAVLVSTERLAQAAKR